MVVRPQLFWCLPFTQIMAQRRKAHVDLGAELGGDSQRHQRVNAGIDLRVPFGGGRYAE